MISLSLPLSLLFIINRLGHIMWSSNCLHLLPTDVTLRNAIFCTKECLTACAHIPSADLRSPHLNYQTISPSPQKRSGHETDLNAGSGASKHSQAELVVEFLEWW